MVNSKAPRGALAPATLPPRNLPGLDAGFSRLVTAMDADGRERTWHVLDNHDDGPAGTLLCLHGNPTWSYLWRHLLTDAPDGYRVVAIDQLDMGYSERTRTLRTLARRIDDLSTVVHALGLTGSIIPVAHDWGGPVAAGWAQRNLDTLGGLILTNTAVHHPPDAAAPSLIRLARTPGILNAACVGTSAFLQGALSLAHPPLSDEVRSAYGAPYRSADRRHAIGAFVRDIPLDDDHRSASTLRDIASGMKDLAHVPTLLVWGGHDPVFSDRYLHDLEERLPQAKVHRAPAAGHLVAEDLDLPSIITGWLNHPVRTSDRREDRDRPSQQGRVALWDRLDDPRLADRTAIVEMAGDAARPADRSLTFGELGETVRATAAGLAADGVAPGDRVALLVEPGAELATALYACWRIGAVVVVVDAGLGPKGITQALRSAAPRHLIGIPRALVAARALRWPGRPIAAGDLPMGAARLLGARVRLSDLTEMGRSRPLPPAPVHDAEAAVVFTSGATGPAKGVVYRHRQIEAQRDALTRTYAIGPDDRLVAAFAPFALYGPMMGITSAVPDMDVTSPGSLRAATLADAAAAIDATLIFASPAALANVQATRELLDDGQRHALRSVRLLLSAGAPVPAALLRSLTTLLPSADPHTPYGMTEALPVADISLTQIEEAGIGNGVCVGGPVSGVEVMISPLDLDGSASGELTNDADITGEVCIRAQHLKDRYDRLWAIEQASARDRGWHRSGDVGHLDDQGRLWIEGRLVQLIRTANGVVTPVGLELQATAVDGVTAAAAVGVGPVGTQQVVLVVVPAAAIRRGGIANVDLTDTIRRAVTIPLAAVLVTPELPVDIRHNSKIDRGRVATWATVVLGGGRAGAL